MFGLGLQNEDKVQTDFFVFGPGRKFKGPKINPVSGVCGTPPSEGLEQLFDATFILSGKSYGYAWVSTLYSGF
jgi:hypothetical protein